MRLVWQSSGPKMAEPHNTLDAIFNLRRIDGKWLIRATTGGLLLAPNPDAESVELAGKPARSSIETRAETATKQRSGAVTTSSHPTRLSQTTEVNSCCL